MRPRLPPITNISHSVGLMGLGHRSRTPQSSKTVGLATENTLINILSEEEAFFFIKGCNAFPPALMLD